MSDGDPRITFLRRYDCTWQAMVAIGETWSYASQGKTQEDATYELIWWMARSLHGVSD